jgi:hypothetical protein
MITNRLRIASIPVLAVILSGTFLWWIKKSPSGQTPAVIEETSTSDGAPKSTSAPPIPATSLADRKIELLRMDPTEAREWLLHELEGGKDYATGSDLSIGTDQNLSTWPSYRVYLLDLLHLVDPVAAAQQSRELVKSSESPDEWAVALRNVARAADSAGTQEWLRSRAAELLRNEAWRSDPSAGYLNAFDVIVHTEHTGLAPELLGLCNDLEAKAVRHASFLVIDRLTQSRPEALLPLLADSAHRLEKSGPMISNLMARADLRDEAQRAAVEGYLLDPRRSQEDLSAFAGIFPNANFHVSNNLLTKVVGIDGIELAERDRAALEIVRDWLEDERFANHRETLERIESRLEKFVDR